MSSFLIYFCLSLCYNLAVSQFGYQNYQQDYPNNYNNYRSYQGGYGYQGNNGNQYYTRSVLNALPDAIRRVTNRWSGFQGPQGQNYNNIQSPNPQLTDRYNGQNNFNNFPNPNPQFNGGNNFNNFQNPQFGDRFNEDNNFQNPNPQFNNNQQFQQGKPQENNNFVSIPHRDYSQDRYVFPNESPEETTKKPDLVMIVESADENAVPVLQPLSEAEKPKSTTESGLIHIEPTTQGGLIHITPDKFDSRDTFGFNDFSPTCTTVTGGEGSCINLLQCSQYVALLQQGQTPELVTLLRKAHCGFEGSTPKVCCPKPGIPNTPPPPPPITQAPVTPEPVKMPDVGKPKAADNEGLYVDDLPYPPVCGVSGGKKFSRIVNGVPAELGQFPWMALLGYRGRRDPSTPRWLCGGSLISSLHVLTAAHCIHGHEDDLYQVRLGELDLESDTEGATPIDVPVKKKIKHHQYSATAFSNDIGILVLDQVVEFTQLIRPICMPMAPELRSVTFERYMPFIAGWGDTEFRGPSATHLQMTQLPVVTNERCARAYAAYKAQVIDQKVLCAGFDEGGKDACQGDSGGPLMQPLLNETYSFYQIGVVSFGKKCAEPGFPGVYSRVTYFMPWIMETVTGVA